MVMVSFARGMTTRAFFQNSASVWMARRTWASLSERTRFQSLAALADVLPVRFSRMSFCPPGRDDSPPATGHVGVDHCNLDAIYNSHSVDARLAVIEALVHLLESGPLEDLDGVLKRNAVTGNVPAIIPGVPNVLHTVIFTLCIDRIKSARVKASWECVSLHRSRNFF